jgi:hypothetical protein
MEKEEAVHHLRETLATPGWAQVIAPSVAQEMQTAIVALCSQGRKGHETDDFLRGKIVALKWILTSPSQTVTDWEASKKEANPDGHPDAVGHPYAEDIPPSEER